MAARSLVRMDEMFIRIAVIGLLGLAIDWGWKLLEGYVLRWQSRNDSISTAPVLELMNVVRSIERAPGGCWR